MMKADPNLASISLAAGEPFLLEVQIMTAAGAVPDMAGRSYVLSFYRDDRSTVKAITGDLLTDDAGHFFRFARDGSLSEELIGQRLSVELSERLRNGRYVITSGMLTIGASAAGLLSLDTAVVGRVMTRITIRDAAALGDDPVFTLTRLPYDPAGGSPAPRWSILPSLTDDGTPQVGEVIGGNDGTIVNGAATGRRFLLNGAPIPGATGASYTPIASDAGKALALEVTATGPGGTHSEVSASILIAAATVQPPVITSPAAIASDGSPQVGEELTGVDPVVERGTVTTRRWMLGSTVLVSASKYTPTETGDHRFVATVTGNDGSTLTSSSTTTVQSAATPSAFTMQQLATPNRIYQRDIVDGVPQMVGTVPVTITVTTAGTLYARTRAVSAGNAVLSPPRKVLDNVATGTRAVAITGVPAIVDEFYLDLSPDGVAWRNGTVPIGMGKLIGYAGQSLMEAMLVRRDDAETMAGVGETPTTAGRVCSEGNAWQAFVDQTTGLNSAGFNALIRLQAAQEGCRIGMIGYAQGATDIAFWVPGGQGWTKFLAAINATGNRLEAMLWFQGHSDSANNSTTGFDYRKQLSALFAAVDANVTDTTFPRYLATIPNISSASWGQTYKKEALRVAGDRWCAENPRAVSIVMDDLELADGVHQKQSGAVRAAIHYHRYMVNPATAVGAIAGPITYTGTRMTVPLTLPAGATSMAITGDLSSRLLVMPRGLRDPGQKETITGVSLGAVSGSVMPLYIDLNREPGGGGVDIDVIFNPKNDPSADGSLIALRNNLAGDGATYGRSFTMAKPARYAMARNLVNQTVMAYGAGRWAGKQGLSGGSARYGLIHANWAEGYTVECWMRHSGATGTNVFLSPAGTYLAVDGTALNMNGTMYAGALPANTWLHIAFTIDAGVLFVHVGGQLVAGGGTPSGQYPPAAGSGIRTLGGNFVPANDACTVSDVAVWAQSKYGRDAFAVPTAAYAGNEPFLDHLYRLDGNANDSIVK